MNFPLYTLVQILIFSKKANNSMKNSARVTNNASNNTYFLLYLCMALTVKFYYQSIFRISKNRF